VSSLEDRRESRRRWGQAAPRWSRTAEAHAKQSMPVAMWLVDAIDPQPGLTVLDLAAGLGETGFLAAELIEPGGTLICSDFAPEMLSAARERAERQGIRNARFRQIDAETAIDLPAAGIDAVLCRWGFMLMADQGTALREARRVLKPGGRLALAAWAAPEDNAWTRLPAAVVARHGLFPPTDPDAPGMFQWAPEGRIAERLEEAGFVEHTVESLPFTHRHASFDAYWDMVSGMGIALREALDRADRQTRDAIVDEVREAAAPFTAPDGSLALPARTWVARAVA
jgi:SAM-dependent methyltransferase